MTFEGFQDQGEQSIEESFRLEKYLELGDGWVGLGKGTGNGIKQEERKTEYLGESH